MRKLDLQTKIGTNGSRVTKQLAAPNLNLHSGAFQNVSLYIYVAKIHLLVLMILHVLKFRLLKFLH